MLFILQLSDYQMNAIKQLRKSPERGYVDISCHAAFDDPNTRIVAEILSKALELVIPRDESEEIDD